MILNYRNQIIKLSRLPENIKLTFHYYDSLLVKIFTDPVVPPPAGSVLIAVPTPGKPF